jgi:hypothetical protein
MRSLRLCLCLLTLLLAGCPSPGGCLEPALQKQTSQKKYAAKIAGKLESLDVSGELSAEYNNVVTKEFAKLNDENAALHLFLSAIDCYLKKGLEPKEAMKLAKDALAAFRQSAGAMGGDDSLELTEGEVLKLRSTSHGSEAIDLLKKFSSPS